MEDDWRRKDKSGSALAVTDPDQEGDEAAEVKDEKDKKESEWKDPSFYTKDIPKDDAALEASNSRVCSAYYISGMIYKEQLKDPDNAIESFEVLNSRFEECRYEPLESFYQPLLNIPGEGTNNELLPKRWQGVRLLRGDHP